MKPAVRSPGPMGRVQRVGVDEEPLSFPENRAPAAGIYRGLTGKDHDQFHFIVPVPGNMVVFKVVLVETNREQRRAVAG